MVVDYRTMCTESVQNQFKVVIPSRNASNLAACVRALQEREPDLPSSNIIVVDDGARSAASDAALPGITWIAGQKPFVFARNANIGIRAANSDVILSNDDVMLETFQGYSRLHKLTRFCGLAAPAVRGDCPNLKQNESYGTGLRIVHGTLSFISILIPRATWDLIGPLDEQFTAYGWEDNDYCRRALLAGMTLTVCGGCVVEHGTLPSTFRHGTDFSDALAEGRAIFERKWMKT